MQVKCSHTEMRDIDLLVENPRNPNKHPDNQIKLLAKIMKHQGWRSPIVVSKQSGFIVKGHGRLMAAKLNGWQHAPIDMQDYATPADEFADMVADNKIAELSETDMLVVNEDAHRFPELDLDLLGIPDFALVDTEVLETGCDEDEVPDHVEPKTKRGDIYKLGNHRLMCGDSTIIDEVQKLMDGKTADLVWTDPPYNVALGMETKEQAKQRNRRTDGLIVMNDKMDDSSFRNFLKEVFLNANLVTKPGGSIYVSHADSEGYNFRGSCRDSGWLIKQCLIWKKSSLVMGRQDYQWIHEPILYGWKDGGSHNWYGDRKQTTVMEFDKPSRNADHPTMKPVELVEYCIKNSSKNGDTVLDIFGGSGTTLIASEKLNRFAMLMELDPRYCDVIVSRWEKYTGKKAELLNG